MIDKRIYLNEKRPVSVDVVQGVVGQPIRLLIADEVLEADTEARVYVEKPSGLTVYQQAELTDKNVITITPNTQTFIEPGTSKMTVQLIHDEVILYSFVILVNVQKNPAMNAGGTESENYDYFLQGAPGPKGEDGVSIAGVRFNADGTLTVILADGTEVTSEYSLKGEPGTSGQDGKDGKDGKDGEAGKDGKDGKDGSDGTTFTPSVSSEGVISWTNDGGKTNPNSVNIKGPAGKDGKDGEDYVLTSQDKQDIADIVLADLPTWTGGAY